MEALIIVVMAWAFLAFVGVLIADSKGLEKSEGCAWGLLLGPLGWLTLAFRDASDEDDDTELTPTRGLHADPDFEDTCPHCGKTTSWSPGESGLWGSSSVCDHCNGFLPERAAEEETQDESDDEDSGTAELDEVGKFSGRPKRKCPYCAELVLLEATVCKHCDREIGEAGAEDRVQPCPDCGNPVSKRDIECPSCGWDLPSG